MKFTLKTFQMKLHESLLCLRVGQALAHYKLTPGCSTGDAGNRQEAMGLPWGSHGIALVRQEQLQKSSVLHKQSSSAQIRSLFPPSSPSHRNPHGKNWTAPNKIRISDLTKAGCSPRNKPFAETFPSSKESFSILPQLETAENAGRTLQEQGHSFARQHIPPGLPARLLIWALQTAQSHQPPKQKISLFGFQPMSLWKGRKSWNLFQLPNSNMNTLQPLPEPVHTKSKRFKIH